MLLPPPSSAPSGPSSPQGNEEVDENLVKVPLAQQTKQGDGLGVTMPASGPPQYVTSEENERVLKKIDR